MARLTEVRVPDMGNFDKVAVIDVLVKPGDTIQLESPLVTLETEKATMDVPSSVAGVVEKVHVDKGARVSAGDLVATVRAEDAAAGTGTAPASPAPAATSAAPSTAASASASAPAPAPEPAVPEAAERAGRSDSAAQSAASGLVALGASRGYAGPSVRKLARELGVDLGAVSGTGFKGRITHDDVKAFVKNLLRGEGAADGARGGALPAIPAVDFAKFGEIEVQPLPRVRRIAASRLHASWVNLPHVTQFDEADITELEETRDKLKEKALKEGVKLTPLAFILRACVRALQEFPQFNSSLDAAGESLVVKKYIHIGFAVDTPAGLLVPVVRDADRKDVYEIARQLAELAEKARAGKLSAAQMQGGSFTISSLGGIGGTAFTPIINAPEVAILGVSRSAMKPVYRDGGFLPRLMLPLSLSYDHRVVDGAAAARFTTFLAKTLEDPDALLEAVP